MLLAIEAQLDAFKEVVVVRDEGADASAMLAPLRSDFVPNRALSLVTDGPGRADHEALVPLIAGKRAGKTGVKAYVCYNRVCKLPTSDPEVFARQLTQIEPLP
jgi:uncharacterized protein YyaL (SSP411 family)